MKNEKVDYTGTYIVKIDKLEKEIERLKEEMKRIKDVYTSMQFSAPENMYIFIEQLGEILDKVGSDKE